MPKPLVIVESPAKARTISRFLGPSYEVEASIGHIRDLPRGASEIPAKLKKEKWARLGVDVDHNFEPLYVVPDDRKDQLKKLKALLDKATELYLATDEDREGEAISWHLLEVLKPRRDLPVKRLVFHEITKDAIQDALAHPRSIDENLVSAQETRRIVDRLYGYEVSPLLWKKIRPQLSAGRVQSVAVRLVVERERERMAFRESEYWDLAATFRKLNLPNGYSGPVSFDATLIAIENARVATGKDFDDKGNIKDKSLAHLDRARANQLCEALANAAFRVASIEEKQRADRPYAPFTTSTLQQESNRRLRFSARRTMSAAQKLYENGFITYMRTDSTSLSEQAIRAARRLIEDQYGREYLPASPRHYETKVKNAQEAHEAIRPAGTDFRPLDSTASLGYDEQKLYELIWKRTVASQMNDARVRQTTVIVTAPASGFGNVKFTASGKTIEFPGFLRAYVEGSDNPEDALADREVVLPPLAREESLKCEKLGAETHKTQPPARLTEATIVKELEARGIGRPSTYASIIETILDRGYVFKKGNSLVPTFTAFVVIRLLERYLSHLVDYAFTAKMEDDLDAISLGQQTSLDYLKQFYHGGKVDGRAIAGLKEILLKVADEIDPREACGIALGKGADGVAVEARVGRYGPFLSWGEKRSSIPDETAPEDLTLARAVEMLAKAAEGPRVLGVDPASGEPVAVKTGRFGPYFQIGGGNGGDKKKEKPKMASLLKDQSPETVTLEEALSVLALPRTIGAHPESGEDVVAASGRFGPYIKCGKDTRSIPETNSPIRITLAEALELLKAPKTGLRGRGRGAPGAAAKNAKILGKSNITEKDVKLLDGRFGPYVTDGVTNASLPKGIAPDEITIEKALELLAERAAKGPSKRRGRGRGRAAAATKK
ncbi:MAG: type I DNA topoisomerase [Planctomycetes bacterium]|nr:type I DNA topoisomerase [Planctomycetota bacterium]